MILELYKQAIELCDNAVILEKDKLIIEVADAENLAGIRGRFFMYLTQDSIHVTKTSRKSFASLGILPGCTFCKKALVTLMRYLANHHDRGYLEVKILDESPAPVLYYEDKTITGSKRIDVYEKFLHPAAD